jgi:regulator of protease activity HflC (stomatin/prohibitin superfamily)
MDFLFDIGFFGIIAVFLIALIAATIKILREYERAVIFTLGRFTGVKGPGLILVIPASSRRCAWTCASRCSTCRART